MREIKSSGTAIVLSFFWTGLGQLYAGRIARGLVMMAATPVVWLIGLMGGMSALAGGLFAAVASTGTEGTIGAGIGLGGLLMGLLPIAWWLFGMLDAKSLCNRHNNSAADFSGEVVRA